MDGILSFIRDNPTLFGALATGWFGYLASRAGQLSKKQYESLKGELQGIDKTVSSNKVALQEHGEELSLMKGGVLGNRRRSLFKDLKLAIERGYTTLEERREMALLYEGYRKLGGNGEIETMYQIYIELEVKGE